MTHYHKDANRKGWTINQTDKNLFTGGQTVTRCRHDFFNDLDVWMFDGAKDRGDLGSALPDGGKIKAASGSVRRADDNADVSQAGLRAEALRD